MHLGLVVRSLTVSLAALAIGARGAAAQPGRADSARVGYTPAECADCAAWNAPQAPFRIHGDTYYVGTRGLASILVTSSAGHVLIDGGLPESAALIRANVRALGFRMEDVRLLLNSHAHFDHAGGLAELQRASGARVAASPWSADVIGRGTTERSDPQFEVALAYPGVGRVQTIADGDTLRVGPLALVAHFTPGHTPGGTTWSWRACDGARCLDVVYADSQTPVSANGFLFTHNATYPAAVADFERGHVVLERLACDVLLTPHPGASRLWERVAARDAGSADALVDGDACRRYAANARTQLSRRLADERAVR